jgi:hypothetical protein
MKSSPIESNELRESSGHPTGRDNHLEWTKTAETDKDYGHWISHLLHLDLSSLVFGKDGFVKVTKHDDGRAKGRTG